MRRAGLLGEAWKAELSNGTSEASWEDKLSVHPSKSALIFFALSAFIAAYCESAALASSLSQTRVLDNFKDLTPWVAQHTDDVSATLHSADGKVGKAVRLDFDFAGVNGYATAHRALPLDLPDNYEISFWLRSGPPGRSPSAKGRSRVPRPWMVERGRRRPWMAERGRRSTLCNSS